MLIPMRFLPACQIVLLAGLLLGAGEAGSAQATGSNALSKVAYASQPAEAPISISPNSQSEPDASATFADILRMVRKEGRLTVIGNNLSQDLGITNSLSVDAPPVLAHSLGDMASHRAIYVVDDTRDVLFRVQIDDAPMVYLANRNGVLQTAGRIKTGRFRSQSFQRIPTDSAKAGFEAEKEFWMKRVSSGKDKKQ
jgi:hypothetical protein